MEKDVGITGISIVLCGQRFAIHSDVYSCLRARCIVKSVVLHLLCIMYWYNSWLVVNILISVEFIPKRAT